MRGPNRTGVVAKREWRTTVLRREFLLVTFGMPLLFLLIGGISAAGSFLAVSHATRQSQSTSRIVGISDPGHLLSPAAFARPLNGARYRRVERPEEGQAQVAAGSLRALLVVPPDYLQTGAFTVYRRASQGLFDDASSRTTLASYALALRTGLIGDRLPPALARRVVQPIGDDAPSILQWSPKRHAFERPNGLEEISGFVVPYAFSMLMLMSIMLGTGYLLHGIIDEKENRVMEVLLSSISHEELLRGKLLGLGGAGLTQMGVWLLIGGVPALLLSHLRMAPQITPGTVALAVVLFALGFAFYGSLMAGIGSLSSSWRESQQVTSVVSISAVIPLMLMPAILGEPNGGLARALSWFPPTAPITLMMRVSAAPAPAWDIGLGIALLVVGIWAVQKITAKLFRLGLLLYGKPPTPREVLRWLRAT